MVYEETKPSTQRTSKITTIVSSIFATPDKIYEQIYEQIYYRPLTRMSFLTDVTPLTLRAISTALLMSASELTKPLN